MWRRSTTDRWYNVFEIYDRQDTLEGLVLQYRLSRGDQEGSVSYIDLALDLLVYPMDDQLVLDEDEFAD